MAVETRITIEQQGGSWVVVIEGAAGTKRFFCATESMAQTFASMFERTLNPISKVA